MNKYTLKKTNDKEYMYIDQDSCSWDNIQDWIMIGVFGLCGCGHSVDIGDDVINIIISLGNKKFQEKAWDDKYEELILHLLDSKGLTEHGSTVYGSWLTDEGKNILSIIKKYE